MRGAPAPNSRDSLGMSQRTLCELTNATENGPTPSGDPIRGSIFGSLVTRRCGSNVGANEASNVVAAELRGVHHG